MIRGVGCVILEVESGGVTLIKVGLGCFSCIIQCVVDAVDVDGVVADVCSSRIVIADVGFDVFVGEVEVFVGEVGGIVVHGSFDGLVIVQVGISCCL